MKKIKNIELITSNTASEFCILEFASIVLGVPKDEVLPTLIARAEKKQKELDDA